MAWPSSSYISTDKLSNTIVNAISAGLATAAGNRNGGAYNLSNNDAVYLKRLLDAVAGDSLMVFSSGYHFVPQTPGGSLTASVQATVTLAPVPHGINGSATNHYLYVSGGTGSAEAVLITGGTAVSGAASGTVIFTPANSHSGAWTIGSATAGIQEAVFSTAIAWSGLNKEQVHIPAGQHNLYAPIYVNRSIRLFGAGINSTVLYKQFDGTQAILVDTFTDSAADFRLDDFEIRAGVTQTSGSFIRVNSKSAPNGFIDHLAMLQCFNGIHLNSARINLDWIHIQDYVGYAIYSQGTTVGTWSHLNLITFNQAASLCSIYVEGTVDGLIISDSALGGITGGPGKVVYGAYFTPTTTSGHVSNLYLSNVLVDSYTSKGIWIDLPGSATPADPPGVGGSIYEFSNIRLAGEYNTAYGLQIGNAGSYSASSIFLKNVFTYGNVIGVYVCSGSGNLSISNCDLRGLSTGGGTALAVGTSATSTGVKAAQISNNTIGYGDRGLTALGAVNGIWIQGTGHTDWVIAGNSIYGSTATILNSANVTGLVVRGNAGIDNVVPAVSSGATITAPLNPIFTITGTTQITTINGGWAGREIALIFTDASPGGVGTGGNIARAQTAVQNQAITLRFNGANWY